ncbi:MAG TPA: DUF3592 domain-containing protein [Dongiaceae bacterium]
MAKTGKSSVPSWLFSAIFLLVGLGMLGGAVYSFVATWRFIGGAIAADGLVIALEERWSSADGDYTYFPQVAFETEDRRRFEFTGDTGSRPAAFDIGEPVRVLFDPARPETARIDSFFQLWLLPLILGGLGTVFSAFGLAATLSMARESMGRGRERRPAAADAAPEPADPPPERPPLPTSARRVSVVERDRRD